MIDASPSALSALYDETIAAAGRERAVQAVAAQQRHAARVRAAKAAVLALEAQIEAAVIAVADGAPPALLADLGARVAQAKAELGALEAAAALHAERAIAARDEVERATHNAAAAIANFAADALLDSAVRIERADAEKKAAVSDYEAGLRALAYASSRGWKQRPNVRGGLRLSKRAPRPEETEIQEYPKPAMMRATLIEMGALSEQPTESKQ
jgi:hypothetical protein